MTNRVPPPPEPEKRTPIPEAKPKAHLTAPLDAGFLGRVYVSTLWLGIVWTACAWFVTKSAIGAGSFAGGVLLGALLLKSQEIFVRRVIAPGFEVGKDGAVQKQNLAARIPIALLLPFKYVAIGLAFAFVIDREWLHPLAFFFGFLTEQVVIFSKIIGRLLARRLR